MLQKAFEQITSSCHIQDHQENQERYSHVFKKVNVRSSHQVLLHAECCLVSRELEGISILLVPVLQKLT